MRTRSVLGVITAASLAAAVLLAPSAANAAQATFVNPSATASTTDFDIPNLDLDYSNTTLTTTIHTQNYVGPDYEVTVYVLSGTITNGGPGSAYLLQAQSSGGAAPTLDASTYKDGADASGVSTVGVTVARSDAADTFTVGIPNDLLTWSGPAYVVAVVEDANNDDAYAAKALGSTIEGLGPIEKGSAATSVAVVLTSPTQVFGSTPASVVATVTPATATGTFSVFDGTTAIVTSPITSGVAVLTLPTGYASGPHALVVRFTPSNAQNFTASASAAFPFSVISAAKATKTTVTLSKKSQVFKKAAAKVKVTVSAKATGTVKLYDGKKVLKTISVKSGKGSYTLSKKLAKGKHTLKAVFTATNIEAFTSSTSKTVKFTVKK